MWKKTKKTDCKSITQFPLAKEKQTKPKASRRKEIMITADINGTIQKEERKSVKPKMGSLKDQPN